MKVHQLVAIGAIAALGAGFASAQGVPPPGGEMPGAATSGGDEFTKLDKDTDGMVSKKEAGKNKDLAKRWDELDVNKDGKLDQGEFARFEASPAGESETGPSTTDKPRF